MTERKWFPKAARVGLFAALLSLLALPALGSGGGAAPKGLAKLSQSVQNRWYSAHPDQAPGVLRATFRQQSTLRAVALNTKPNAPPFGDRFNNDVWGLPQNEESVSVCQTEGSGVVLEGTNDYRGNLNDAGNFTGWHLSLDGGATLQNEGLLPTAFVGKQPYPNQGDPVDVTIGSGGQCTLYASALAFPYPDFTPSGIAVYKTDLATASSCDTSESPFHANEDCWPTSKVVAYSTDPEHFFDKEWMAVGDTGDGTNVWVTYTDFDFPNGFGETPFTNQIYAVKCDADLTTCTAPILISGTQNSLQFSDVTIAPDGSTVVTWEEDNDFATDFQGPEHMQFWVRVAPPGSTVFGPMHKVAKAPHNVTGALQGNDFRVATVPKNEAKTVSGHIRLFLTYDECKSRPFGTICEHPQIKLTWSDDGGVSWSIPEVISAGGVNYFPSIVKDTSNGNILVAYYTNRFDPQFENRQDVELVTINAVTGAVTRRQRVTSDQSNETEADPFLGGFFIGDYMEVSAMNGGAWVGYNANIHDVKVLGSLGVPVPQQDNYVSSVGE